MKQSKHWKTLFYTMLAITATVFTACVDDDVDKQAPMLELSEEVVAFTGTATEDATVSVRSNRQWTVAYEDEETQREWMYFKVSGNEVSEGIYNGDGTVKITVGESAQPHMGRLVFTLSNSYGELYRKYLTVTQGNYVPPTVGAVGKLVEYILGDSRLSGAVGTANAMPLRYGESTIEAVILANDAAGNNNRKLYVGDNNGLERSAIVLYGEDFAMANDPVTKYPAGRKVTLNLENANYYAFNNVRQLTDVVVTVGEESVELVVPSLSVDKFNSGDYQAQYVKLSNMTPQSSWVGKSWTTANAAQSVMLNDAAGKTLTVYMNQGRYATGFADMYVADKTGTIYGVAETYRENAQLIPTKKADIEALSSNQGGGTDPDPTPSKAITVNELYQLAETVTGKDKLVIDAENNRTLDAVVVTDAEGGNVSANNLMVMAEGATQAKNGILLFSSGKYTNPKDPAFPFKAGDKVRFTLMKGAAKVANFSNCYEVTCESSDAATWLTAEVIGKAQLTPVPLTSIDKLIDYQGMLVTVKNVTSPATAGDWAVGTTTFKVGSADLTVYVTQDAAAFAGKQYAASKTGDLTGYVSLYKGAVQLCPRDMNDAAAFAGGDTPDPIPGEGLISSAADVKAGTYAILFQHSSNNNYYYLPNDAAVAKNPAAKIVELADGKLTSAATADMKWTLTGDNTTGFVVSGDGMYLTSTDTAQGIVTTTTVSTQTWNFKDDDTNGMLMQSPAASATRNLSVFIATDGTTATWRYYAVGNSYLGKLYLLALDGGTAPAEPTLTVDPTSLSFAAKDQAKTIACTVANATGYTVGAESSDAANFAVAVSGTTVTVTPTENTGSARNATITVYLTNDGGATRVASQTVAVEQAAAEGGQPAGKSVTMTSAQIIANGTTTITENNYGSQDVSKPDTYYKWTIDGVEFGGAKICKAPAGDYAGLIQMQGNASDAVKQGFLGNAAALGKITKIVIVSQNTKYEPTEHLYMGTSAYTLKQNAQTRTSMTKEGNSYTETFEISGDFGFFTLANDKTGAFYVESITVYYE